MQTLLPLYTSPQSDPETWRRAAGVLPPGGLAVIGAAAPGLHPAAEIACDGALRGLTDRGIVSLGYVDLAFATRSFADIASEVAAWSRRHLSGVFFDQAPTSPFAIGFVAIVTQAARQAGLTTVLLNPGAPTDPLYRGLGATICSYEGPWSAYQQWDADGCEPGDAHLVYDVPMAQTDDARRLIASRGAGCALITDWDAPDPYGLLPQWAWFAASRAALAAS